MLVVRVGRADADGRRVVIADLPVDADARRAARRDRTERHGWAASPSPEECGGPAAVGRAGARRGDVRLVPADRRVHRLRGLGDRARRPRRPSASTRRCAALYDAASRRRSRRSRGVADRRRSSFLLVAGRPRRPAPDRAGRRAVVRRRCSRDRSRPPCTSCSSGTERVQQGDFAHRIRIDSRDQLGDLAESFNRMSAQHRAPAARAAREAAARRRAADRARDSEVAAARRSRRVLPGLSIADLCEPAREVGGDYYDFFELGPRQLGVLIADVSGKGTSAALYMAELKGLMLALSHDERSPRQLLIDVNRLLAEHLDNRSFITMTYAVIDLDARTLTCARAGHTPLIVVSGGESEVIVPAGMVLGLRLPGAGERFEDAARGAHAADSCRRRHRALHRRHHRGDGRDRRAVRRRGAGAGGGRASSISTPRASASAWCARCKRVRRRRRAARRHDDGRAEGRRRRGRRGA